MRTRILIYCICVVAAGAALRAAPHLHRLLDRTPKAAETTTPPPGPPPADDLALYSLRHRSSTALAAGLLVECLLVDIPGT